MSKPCAVFWDIQNVEVPRGQSVDSIVNLVRSTIIKPHNLNEIFFFCVCDVHKLSSNIGNSLTNLDFQAYDGIKDSADIKIMDLMRKFVKLAGQDCTIILINGSADYYGTLNDLKKLYNVSIHLIRFTNSFSPRLVQISDYTFMLDKGVLKPVKPTGLLMYFISIKNYPLIMNMPYVMDILNSKATGSIEKSAILLDDSICIGFPTLLCAERAIEQLNGSQFHGSFLEAELIVNAPLTDILNCIKPNVIMNTENINEVKQLTFININNPDEVTDGDYDSNSESDDDEEITERVLLYKGECTLSRKPFASFVFPFKSDAQKCLPYIQILFPDAVITEPPIDLRLKWHKNSYSIESYVDITTNGELQNAVNFDVRDDLKIFFRYNSNFATPMLYYRPTKWSLLYNLFEQLYDLGAKKVIFDGKLYCAHFDTVSAYQDAFEKIRSRYLEPLEFVKVPETRKQEVTKKMDLYEHGIPWCLTQELDIYCLVIDFNCTDELLNQLMEISKNRLENCECIFIKSFRDRIWVGFPDEHMCKNFKKKVIKQCLTDLGDPDSTVYREKSSDDLLKAVTFQDLASDAYDLAFLSNQLESSKPIKNPRIIERISCQLKEKQKSNEVVFTISVNGNFYNRVSWNKLSLEQIVKIFVKFSKVIPLAVTASYNEVMLIYNTYHEAHTARHFIDNITFDEVPYFAELGRTGFVQQQQLTCSKWDYYIINDKQKVLEKILQNRSLMDRPSSNSSKVQSTSDIDVLDGEMVKKLKYLFVITTDSDFKFTSGMISIIKMNLVSMDCPAFVEFDDKIWVGVDDLEKGNKVKADIEFIEFKILHENDEDDFEIGVVMKLDPGSPTVTKMLANKLMNPTKKRSKKTYLNYNVVPLGHFNYNYRKAVGMSSSLYHRLNKLVPSLTYHTNTFDEQ